MPERARVTSLEAIESFRANLIVYREKAARILDEVNDRVTRTKLWLQSDRVPYWQNQIRQRDRELKEKLQELFNAQMSGLREASAVQQQAVQKARHALRDAEAQLTAVKQWTRQFDQAVEPLAHQVEKFRHDLGHDLGMAVAWMMELSKTLNAYAELSPMSATVSPASSANENPAAAPSPEERSSKS